MLGIDFFTGTPTEAITHLLKHGGMVIAPAAPSFVALQDDPHWRSAVGDADVAIADSGWAVLFWRIIQRERLTRISGLALFKALLETPESRVAQNLFFVLPSKKAKEKTLKFARNSGYPISFDDCYVAPGYNSIVEDRALLAVLESRKPKHVIIGIGSGMQDKLGSYLKRGLTFRPAIYCIGAAPAFVTGDQVVIPAWADRFFLGWIFRLITQPRTLLPRLWTARRLPGMMLRYRRELPELA
jgi:UDP-N-acetyl-D-mannosaminuronic acid transferase (WecB/TagA/CpsF family)